MKPLDAWRIIANVCVRTRRLLSKGGPVLSKPIVSKTSWMARRWVSYAFGLFLVALSVSFSVKSALGISPASSIAYVASLINGWSMGTWTAISYSLFVLLQALLKGRAFEMKNILQIPVSLAFGVIVDGTNLLLTLLPDATTYPVQLLYLAISLIIMGFGYVYYLPPDIISLPSEGVMQAIAYRFHLKNSTAKLIWDPLCVAVTIGLSFAFLGGLVGIREGTIVAAVGNGLAMKFFMKLFKERLSDPLLGEPHETASGPSPALL